MCDLELPLRLPELSLNHSWFAPDFTQSGHLLCGDGESVHICYGKLLLQMSPENLLNRNSCSLRKPPQMPGRHCEAFVIASQVLPVQLRNSCMYNALHLLGCHKNWRTEGKLWSHIFPWLICWEGKHFRQKQWPLVFLTLLCADWSCESLDSPCCLFGSHQTQRSPLWRHLQWLQHYKHPFHCRMLWCLWNSQSFSALPFYPAMSFAKWKVKSFLQNLIHQQLIPL